jgi:hypothetical protein
VYAHVSSFPQHERARAWLDEQLNGAAPVGLPWSSLRGFLRLVTNPRVFERPEPVAQAWAQISAWLACENTWIPLPTGRHAEVLCGLLASPGVHADLVADAALAALAVEHDLLLCSTDSDFARFSAVRWQNPL